jgi:hypothetical protein
MFPHATTALVAARQSDLREQALRAKHAKLARAHQAARRRNPSEPVTPRRRRWLRLRPAPRPA